MLPSTSTSLAQQFWLRCLRSHPCSPTSSPAPLAGVTSLWQHSSSPCSSPCNLQQQSSLASSSEVTAAASTPVQTFKQRRLIGWTPEQVYNVVSNVDDYHKFVPWCIGSRVLRKNKEGNHLEAELEVGFQLLRERYISLVTLKHGRAVSSTVRNSALFHRLDSTWAMDPGMVPKSCWISFHVEFAFQRATYNHVVSLFFSEVTRRMMSAFEGRCEELYGPSSLVKNISRPVRPRDRAFHSPSQHQCSPERGRGEV